MRIIDYDELPGAVESQVQLLDASTGWMPIDFRRIEAARKLGYPAADYFGVYAVEKGDVLSMVRVLRIPYTMGNGVTETMSSVQGVVTRRDWSRKGLARMLLDEVHRREAAAGNRFAMLWTGHSNMAHNLYRSARYVDVFTPSLAIRRCGGPQAVRGRYEMRAVRAGDAETMERLHAESTKGRVGFTPRPKGYLPVLFKLGLVKPDFFRLIVVDGEPVGFVQVQKGRGWTRSEEVVLTADAEPGEVVSLLESEAGRGWLVVVGTFVRDSSDLLRRRGYSLTDHSYYGLLARALSGAHPNLRKEVGAGGRMFTCHFLDYF